MLGLAVCGGANRSLTPTPNPEPVTFAILAPFDSRQLTPDAPEDAPTSAAGETTFTWESVPGAARYEVWILDRSNPATLDNPVPGETYDQGETDEPRWDANLEARPGMDDAGREMSVEVSAYDAAGSTHLDGRGGVSKYDPSVVIILKASTWTLPP